MVHLSLGYPAPYISSYRLSCLHYMCVHWSAVKARVVVFFVSGSLFVAGVAVILIGILCKLGRLHPHFRKSEAYKELEEDKRC